MIEGGRLLQANNNQGIMKRMDENRINQLCKDLNIDREDVKVYESSYNLLDQCELFMAKLHGEKMLISYGGGKIFDELEE